MEELLKAFMELLETGEVSSKNVNVKIDQDADGNITLKYEAPKKSKLVAKIKAEIAEIDEDIFTETIAKFRKADPAKFAVMASMEDKHPDEKSLAAAYDVFKRCLIEVVEARVKRLSTETNRLFCKYLDTKHPAKKEA